MRVRGATLGGKAKIAGAIGGLLAGAMWAGCDCGGDGDSGHSSRTSAVLGAAGGTLVSSDGRLEMRVPPGALDHEVEVFIEPDPEGATELPGRIGVPYRLGPPGTTFTEPVTLLLHFDPAALGGRDAQALRVATSAAGLAWSCIPMSGTDEQGAVVVVSVMHLSIWALRFQDCDEDGDCKAPERCTATGVCAIPCTVAAERQGGGASVLSCVGGLCNHGTCEGDGDCGAERVCSSNEGPGVCLPACEARSRCGFPTDQQICTPAA